MLIIEPKRLAKPSEPSPLWELSMLQTEQIIIGSPRDVEVAAYVHDYIGDGYAETPDFKLAEFARRLDMRIQDRVAKRSDLQTAEDLRYAGWGQLVSMAFVLGSITARFGHSADFTSKLHQGIEGALLSVEQVENPMGEKRVVTKHTKPALMNPTHPTLPSSYLPWKSLEGDSASAVLRHFEQIVSDTEPHLVLEKGSILLMVHPRNNTSILNALWSDESRHVQEAISDLGYRGLRRPNIESHITLVNAEQVEKLKEIGDDWQAQLKSLLEEVTGNLRAAKNILGFSGIKYTFSTEFSTYTDVVVASVVSDVVDSAMEQFKRTISQRYGVDIKTKPVESFHLTFAATPREPWPLRDNTSMETILDGCGMHRTALRGIWDRFQASFPHS